MFFSGSYLLVGTACNYFSNSFICDWNKSNNLFITVFLLYLTITHRLLSTAQGSLLDDEQLVNTLHTSKITSSEVSEQLQTSEQTEIKIDTAREVKNTYFYFSVFWFNFMLNVPFVISKIFCDFRDIKKCKVKGSCS